MAPPTTNEIAKGAGAGKHAKRNNRKKELAKQRKAEAQAKAAKEDEILDKLSAVDLVDARESNNVPTNSKVITIPTKHLERKISKDEGQGSDQGSTKVPNNVPIIDGALYEVKPAPGKGLGMFAIKTIKKGTEILREEAIFKGSKNWFSKHAMFTLLPDEKKSQFMALHSQCNCGKEKCDETDLQKIWDANSFEITLLPALPLPTPYAGPFVYLVASRINRDCAPNTTRGFTDQCQIVFRANKDIQAGEEITTDYAAQGGKSVAARRHWLLKKHQFTCTCQACAKNVQLSQSDIAKGFDFEVIIRPGLPVLGEHTVMEEQAFAEVDIWHRQLKSKIQDILEGTIFALAQKMAANSDDSDITVDRVYKEKMQRLYDCVLKNDQYGLGLKIVFLILHRMQDEVALQTHKEFEAMSSMLPLVEHLRPRERLAGNGA